MIGKLLSRYRILEQVGAGGMGVVYRARDERLNRDVALKVLPIGALTDEIARRRFRKEAQALSQLNHPSIATVYDFDTQDGVDFLVMEFIGGEGVNDRVARGPMPERDVIRFGLQAVEGLMAAHQSNIIHRDMKPSNLRITPDSRLKVLDFGLAQLVRTGEDWAVTKSTTATPSAQGTVPYMAPEQLRDEELDVRTDIYGLGAVLYEMATGQRPFPETRGPRLIDSILHGEPKPPRSINRNLSAGLEQIILKALDKSPDRRYQSTKEFHVDLERLSSPTSAFMPPLVGRRRAALGKWLAATALALAVMLVLWLDLGRVRTRWSQGTAPVRIESVAILPLENLSGDPTQEYFADGMTDALVNELTRVKALRVISRWSVMRYKGTHKPLLEIARELGVDGIVLGSVVRSEGRVQVRLQLILPAKDRDTTLWANRYEGELRDVLSLQNTLVSSITQELHVQLTATEQAHLAQARPVNPEAHDAYLQGRFHWNKRTEEGLRAALKSFELAIQKDPTYAPAHAGLADTYDLLGGGRFMRPAEARPRAMAAARRAIELDDSLAEAHTALASLLYDDANFPAAEREFRRALELNPGYATALHWYAWQLAALGRNDEALQHIRIAQEREPFSMIIRTNAGFLQYLAGNYDKAIEQCRATMNLDPTFGAARECMAQAYLEVGRFDEAIQELQRTPDLDQAELGYALGVAGLTAEARKLLAEMRQRARTGYVPSYDFAVIYTGLDDRDAAFEWLEKAREEKDSRLVTIRIHPRYKKLRSDPRFRDLLARMGLASLRTP